MIVYLLNVFLSRTQVWQKEKKKQQQSPSLSAVAASETFLHLLTSLELCFGISHDLFKHEGSRKEDKHKGTQEREQDTTRQGQKNWHILLLTIHYGD